LIFEEQNRKCQINQTPNYFVFAKDFAIASYYKNREIFLYSKKKVFCFQETSDAQKVQFTFIKYIEQYGYKIRKSFYSFWTNLSNLA